MQGGEGGSSRTLLETGLLGKVVTLILAGGEGRRLGHLTRDRSKPAVPFGANYRIIDFTLSNCMNSGMRRVYLLTQYKSQSLARYIKWGWNIYSPALGEFIATVPPQLRVGQRWYEGTADAVYQNIYTMEDHHPEHVLLLSGDHIYRMDYREMLADHVCSGADATMAVIRIPARDASRFGVVEVDDAMRVRGFREKPKDVDPEGPDVVANMGVYIFRYAGLVDALEADAVDSSSSHDFGKDIFPKLVRQGALIQAHRFRGAGEDIGDEPYWMDIGTLDAYFEANMDLVKVSPRFNLYDRLWPLRCGPTQNPPAKFVFADGEDERRGKALDSLVAAGCIISGGRVERSILGPGCRVNSWAKVEDCIFFGSVEVGRHAVVRKAIIDKEVRIPPGMEIGVDSELDRQRFTVTENGLVIVPRHEQLG